MCAAALGFTAEAFAIRVRHFKPVIDGELTVQQVRENLCTLNPTIPLCQSSHPPPQDEPPNSTPGPTNDDGGDDNADNNGGIGPGDQGGVTPVVATSTGSGGLAGAVGAFFFPNAAAQELSADHTGTAGQLRSMVDRDGGQMPAKGKIGHLNGKMSLQAGVKAASGAIQIGLGSVAVGEGLIISIIGAASCEAGVLPGCGVIPVGVGTSLLGALLAANGLINLNNVVMDRNDPTLLEGIGALLGGDRGATLGRSIQRTIDIGTLPISGSRVAAGIETGAVRVIDALEFGVSVENEVNR